MLKNQLHLPILSARSHSKWNAHNVAIYHTAYIGTHFVFIHEFVVRVRQLSFRSTDGYSVVPASKGHRIDSCQSADTCSCIFCNWFGFCSNNNIWLVQCCAYHRKKFHHHCIQNRTCMYKLLLCCYMLHRRRILSLRYIRSCLNEIYIWGFQLIVRGICRWKSQVKFSSLCETYPKSCFK
jgi:hypothetical protein